MDTTCIWVYLLQTRRQAASAAELLAARSRCRCVDHRCYESKRALYRVDCVQFETLTTEFGLITGSAREQENLFFFGRTPGRCSYRRRIVLVMFYTLYKTEA